MTLCTPCWTYNESFYAALTEGAKFCIKTDNVKGKSLFARRKIFEGDIVHEETALCCSQNLDDFLNEVPVCGNCLVYLESPAQSVVRLTDGNAPVSAPPYQGSCANLRQFRCMHWENGCTMIFCCVRCREAAWSRFHFAGCRGRMADDQKTAYDEFVSHDWLLNGLNYSDTVFFAFRFVCMVLTSVRLHHQLLETAYQPVSQLAKMPLTHFRFTYLLGPTKDNAKEENGKDGGVIEEHGKVSENSDEKDAEKAKKVNQQWLKQLEDFRRSNAQGSLTEVDDAAELFLSKGVELLDRILRFSEEERCFFTPHRWSELLGAILLNGQERNRPSHYQRLKEKVKALPGGHARIDAFEEKLRAAGVDPQKLSCGSRGQGVYTIGCLFNHSCEPNLQVLYTVSGDETLSIEALRDIEPGEELNISYIDDTLPYPRRQLSLLEHYLFQCACPRCTREAPEWEGCSGQAEDKSVAAPVS